MLLNENNMVSITDINRNFSKYAKVVKDKQQSLVVMKNNKPELVVMDFEEYKKLTEDRNMARVKELMKQYHKVFEALAK